MGWRIAADITMAAHFGFLIYVALGGFLAWKWRWMIIPHLGAAAYGAGTVFIGWDCPLTGWEDEFRHRAGQEGLPPTGFIDHYLEGVVYPESNLVFAQTVVAILIAISWAGLIWLWQRSRGADSPTPAATDASGPSQLDHGDDDTGTGPTSTQPPRMGPQGP
ncbi:DUF2784 domain-containing protein [Natronoglycomyces albus]|uniref:DUF2784 domain-containing protein n=1 Tax=Natronoglycomyces albus TaxID=2811108 RepID=A0A895XRR3_9ACTN|nr:DUF2784 domain-containing protein [Natronoglycomyces albus]QSB04308.1 DUF2784 domain-containing protein [Natronoglycomyces albus]